MFFLASYAKYILPLVTMVFFATGLLFPSTLIAADDSSNMLQTNILKNRKVHRFIDEMVMRHNYPREQLLALMAKVRFMPELLGRLSKPAEALPWYQYRAIFLTPERIDEGVRFRYAHKDALARAEEVYGVPAKVIVAILGVETYFGRRKGKYPVLDSLVTLAFQSSMRTDFFRSELEQFLLLVNEEKRLDANELKGSYAGAMGLPQFISSSYRRYAVDFDGDNRRDLFNNIADAIGSAAHYLAEHGWQRGRGITVPVEVDEVAIVTDDLLMKRKGSPPHIAFSALRDHGVVANDAMAKVEIPDDEKVALIELEMKTGFVYWVGLQNFYTITRYNHSNLYAMAVHQLAEVIHERYLQRK
uniref:Membrane-bound lytic murein transglycosylase B n=1 Tax=Candidatus Kentrum eta TaxID=2126337 RepID=A0A450VBK0_9GAMM|nr:MAG: membrane-bound lytic murein transglycosylase B [Candidatus Kentron sp. H]VFK02515.1 MAG: membrane-bound lytic murein transglycosylase B [Candidatus Kentron sp. H]VFK05459.1 MAG: membrane-bound lytic murein transglycosylase B [Candidatus Kentron sp. H]